jgi:hypothetical protein
MSPCPPPATAPRLPGKAPARPGLRAAGGRRPFECVIVLPAAPAAA